MTYRALALAAVLMSVGCEATAQPPEITDERSCGHSTNTVNDATEIFELVVPDDATDLRFLSTTGGMGGISLTLAFSTTPAGLEEFLSASHLPTPAPGPGTLFAGTPSCGLGDDFTYSAVVDHDSYVESCARSLAVDEKDPVAPRVLVVAAIL